LPDNKLATIQKIDKNARSSTQLIRVKTKKNVRQRITGHIGEKQNIRD